MSSFASTLQCLKRCSKHHANALFPKAQSIIHTPATPLTRLPNPLPKDIKHKRHRNQQRREAARDTRSRPNANVVIHGTHDERERARQTGAQKGIGGDSGGGVLGEGIDEIVERSLEDGEETRAHHRDADAEHDPMNGGIGRPAHEELTAGEEQ